MVFLPWRNEDVDIIGDSPNYARRYSAELEKIMEMEGKYNNCVQTLEEAVEEFDQYGHAWQNVAPTAEQECIQAEIKGHIEERHQDPEEIDEHTNLIEQQYKPTAELYMRFNTQTDTSLMSSAEYYQCMRILNEQQRKITMYHRNWFKNVIDSSKTRKQSLITYFSVGLEELADLMLLSF